MLTKDIKVTFFKNVRDTLNPQYIEVSKIFEGIRSGKTTKDIINELSQIEGNEAQTTVKKKLPVICFSGEFANRSNAGILKHSGLICIDFDHLNERLSEFRTKVENDKYTFACFLSPRRDGLKVIIKIPADIDDHELYFEALRLHFKEKTMDDDSEISRCCFASFDPAIYINYDSALFDIKINPKVEVAIDYSTRKNRIKDPEQIYQKIKKWADKNDTYEDGNKHRFLVSLFSACNRFGLLQEFAVKKVTEDYQGKASLVKSEDFEDIANRIYISYSNQFDISWLTDNGELNDFNPTGPARDVIYLNDIRKEMIHSYEVGDTKGDTTYFKTIDEHFTWKRGELTLMGGIPGHGKTTMMLQLCLIRSAKEGLKWGVFSPEQNPPIDFYKDLIHTYIGKSTEKNHKKNYMSRAEYEKGMDFIHEHFFFVYPKDNSPTPKYINERFGELIVKHKIDGCITDPFNQLDNDLEKANGRDDQYISVYLNDEKRFALDNKIYKIIIAHPRGNLQKVKNTHNYECPDEYNLSGGAMWANKCDNILATYRPFHGEDKSNPTVEFRSQKIKKQKYVGIPGNTTLSFDIFSNRYLEFGSQQTVEMNGEIVQKWVGINPLDDDYEQQYEEYSKKAGELNAINETNVGMSKLGTVNDVTNQLRANKSIHIFESLPPDDDYLNMDSYDENYNADS